MRPPSVLHLIEGPSTALLAAGQAAGEAAHGVLHLVERPSTALAAGQAAGEAAHGVLYLVERPSTALLAAGEAAHGVLHLIEGPPPPSLLSFFSLLSFLSIFLIWCALSAPSGLLCLAFPVGWPVVILRVAGLHGGRGALQGWEDVQAEKAATQKAIGALLLLDFRRITVFPGGVFGDHLRRFHRTLFRHVADTRHVALPVEDALHDVPEGPWRAGRGCLLRRG